MEEDDDAEGDSKEDQEDDAEGEARHRHHEPRDEL